MLKCKHYVWKIESSVELKIISSLY